MRRLSVDGGPLRPAGPSRAAELALAGVMSSVTVALAVIGWIVPHAGPVQLLGAVPLGVVAHRSRPRALRRPLRAVRWRSSWAVRARPGGS